MARHLDRLAGVTQKALRAKLRSRFVKIAEYQARGVVHFHVVVRLDAAGEGYQPPPALYTAELLCDAIDQAAAAVRIVIDHQDQAVALGFGPQTDCRVIRHGTGLPGTGQALNGQAVANYIAKYATKTLSGYGVPSTRIRRETDIAHLCCPAHYRAMITAAWQLGGIRRDTRFRAWAHMLGYGGHFLTKSRRYSVTFGQLRTLELPRRGADTLRLHRDRQDQLRERAGERWHDNDLVFASRVGTALLAGNVRRSFRAVLAAAGLDPADWTP